MFKHLREEVPEDTDVGRQVRYRQSATGGSTNMPEGSSLKRRSTGQSFDALWLYQGKGNLTFCSPKIMCVAFQICDPDILNQCYKKKKL